MSCGAETEANALLAALTAGKSFDLPIVDLNSPEFKVPADDPSLAKPNQLANSDLTTGKVGGNGTFDELMNSIRAHLVKEYEANRITGPEFTKAYIAMTQSALGGAVQYLLGRDQSYWAAISAEMQVKIAKTQLTTERVKLEIAKAELQSKRYEALNQEAGYALIKMKLSTESMQYCLAKFNLDHMAPVQLAAAREQTESVRAQTMDTRTDGATPITGLMGKQKDLYNQQIVSYQRDAEVKATKLFTDAWITQKTIDEGLIPPNAFNNSSLETILQNVKNKNGIG